MKALTIIQPWAALLACGAKEYETRHWATRYRGPIAIHAGRFTHVAVETCMEDDYRPLIKAGGYHTYRDLGWGGVIAIATLDDCILMTPSFIAEQTFQERDLGNWAPGRYAWRLTIIERHAPPISCRGKQGLWDWQEMECAA